MKRRQRHPGRVLIVGATGGVGEPLVEMLHGLGCSLTLVNRSTAKAEKAFAHLDMSWNSFECDLRDLDAVERVGRLLTVHRFDSIVLNAGMVEPVPFVDATSEHYLDHFLSNSIGLLSVVRPSLAEMWNGSGGRLVANVSSASLLPLTNYGAYSGSKAALRAQLLSMGQEFWPKVSVTGVFLSGVETRQLALEDESPHGSPLNYASSPQSPSQAAETIVSTLTRRRPRVEVYSPWSDAMAARLSTLIPNQTRGLIRLGEAYGRRRQAEAVAKKRRENSSVVAEAINQ